MTDLPTAVSVDVPAIPGFVQVLRNIAAGVAARLDMPIDQIEELRLAVTEAASLLLDEVDATSLRMTIGRDARNSGREAECRRARGPVAVGSCARVLAVARSEGTDRRDPGGATRRRGSVDPLHQASRACASVSRAAGPSRPEEEIAELFRAAARSGSARRARQGVPAPRGVLRSPLLRKGRARRRPHADRVPRPAERDRSFRS